MAESSSAAAPEEEEEEESGLLNAVDAVPFIVHVLLVFVIAWLLLPVTSHGFLLLCLGILYLVQVLSPCTLRDSGACLHLSDTRLLIRSQCCEERQEMLFFWTPLRAKKPVMCEFTHFPISSN
jgi:hypothetical protein